MVVHLYTHFKVVCDGGGGVGLVWWCCGCGGVVGCSGVGWVCCGVGGVWWGVVWWGVVVAVVGV